MNESVYSVLAYIARYWFAFLALVIIWRAIVWVRKDADYVSLTQSQLPDAGFIGEWAVVASNVEEIPPGLVMRASQDGWIGSARACDVRLKNAGVPAHAARFFLRGDGLHLLPQRKGILLVDGREVYREAVLRHGATLTVGGVTLQLRLFAGILLTGEIPEPILAEEDDAYEDEEYEEHDDEIIYDDEEDIIIEEDGYDEAYPEQAYPRRTQLPDPAMTVRTRRRRRQ